MSASDDKLDTLVSIDVLMKMMAKRELSLYENTYINNADQVFDNDLKSASSQSCAIDQETLPNKQVQDIVVTENEQKSCVIQLTVGEMVDKVSDSSQQNNCPIQKSSNDFSCHGNLHHLGTGNTKSDKTEEVMNNFHTMNWLKPSSSKSEGRVHKQRYNQTKVETKTDDPKKCTQRDEQKKNDKRKEEHYKSDSDENTRKKKRDSRFHRNKSAMHGRKQFINNMNASERLFPYTSEDDLDDEKEQKESDHSSLPETTEQKNLNQSADKVNQVAITLNDCTHDESRIKPQSSLPDNSQQKSTVEQKNQNQNIDEVNQVASTLNDCAHDESRFNPDSRLPDNSQTKTVLIDCRSNGQPGLIEKCINTDSETKSYVSENGTIPQINQGSLGNASSQKVPVQDNDAQKTESNVNSHEELDYQHNDQEKADLLPEDQQFQQRPIQGRGGKDHKFSDSCKEQQALEDPSHQKKKAQEKSKEEIERDFDIAYKSENLPYRNVNLVNKQEDLKDNRNGQKNFEWTPKSHIQHKDETRSLDNSRNPRYQDRNQVKHGMTDNHSDRDISNSNSGQNYYSRNQNRGYDNYRNQSQNSGRNQDRHRNQDYQDRYPRDSRNQNYYDQNQDSHRNQNSYDRSVNKGQDRFKRNESYSYSKYQEVTGISSDKCIKNNGEENWSDGEQKRAFSSSQKNSGTFNQKWQRSNTEEPEVLSSFDNHPEIKNQCKIESQDLMKHDSNNNSSARTLVPSYSSYENSEVKNITPQVRSMYQSQLSTSTMLTYSEGPGHTHPAPETKPNAVMNIKGNLNSVPHSSASQPLESEISYIDNPAIPSNTSAYIKLPMSQSIPCSNFSTLSSSSSIMNVNAPPFEAPYCVTAQTCKTSGTAIETLPLKNSGVPIDCLMQSPSVFTEEQLMHVNTMSHYSAEFLRLHQTIVSLSKQLAAAQAEYLALQIKVSKEAPGRLPHILDAAAPATKINSIIPSNSCSESSAALQTQTLPPDYLLSSLNVPRILKRAEVRDCINAESFISNANVEQRINLQSLLAQGNLCHPQLAKLQQFAAVNAMNAVSRGPIDPLQNSAYNIAESPYNHSQYN